MNSEKIIKLRKKFSKSTARLLQSPSNNKVVTKDELLKNCAPIKDSSSRRADRNASSSRKIKKKHVKSDDDIETATSKKERKAGSAGGGVVKQGSGRVKGSDRGLGKRKSQEKNFDKSAKNEHQRHTKMIVSSKRFKEKRKEQKDTIAQTPPREKKDSTQKGPNSPPDCPAAEADQSNRHRKSSDDEPAPAKKQSSDNEWSAICERETIPLEIPATALKLPDEKDSREENEWTDVEAERPHKNNDEKVVLQAPAQLKLGTCVYEIVQGSVVGDYGSCVLKNSNNNEYCILRYESIATKCKRLKIECTVLVLAAASKRRHMLRLLMRGSMDDIQLKYLLTECIGPALPDVLHQLGTRCFSKPTAFKLSLETVEAIEDLHKIGLIHRDIKPAAFSVGLSNQASRIYMTHFGLAKKYRSTTDLKVIAPRKSVPFMGTVKYASRAVHKRGERSRRDDIESWIFVIAEFFCAKSLPWRKIDDRSKVLEEKCIFMSENGITTAIDNSARLPKETKPLVMHVLALDFETGPDYTFLRKVLRDGMELRRIWNNDPFEWEVDEPGQVRLTTSSSRNEATVDSTQQQSLN